MNFCSSCGSKVELRIPEDDDKPRFVCLQCSTVHYSNPKMVVGTIPEMDSKILLCRRAIEPKRGKWTLPAGYLENGESVLNCALRETREEACADLINLDPYLLIDLPSVNLIYFIFRAQLVDHRFSAGVESMEVKLITPDEIPWSGLAFGSMRATLTHYCHDLKGGEFPFRNITLDPDSAQSRP